MPIITESDHAHLQSALAISYEWWIPKQKLANLNSAVDGAGIQTPKPYLHATYVTSPIQIKLNVLVPTIHNACMEHLQISFGPILHLFPLALQHTNFASFILTKIPISIKVPDIKGSSQLEAKDFFLQGFFILT